MTDKSKKKQTEKDKTVQKETEDLLAEANAKAEEYLNLARRLQAEFDNFRKRTERENAEYKKYAVEGVMKDLLIIADDFDRALATANEETELVTGIRRIRGNLTKILEDNGVTQIPDDERFDPNVHEAMCTVDADTDGEIAEVLQKGYRIGEKIIRCPKVIVTKKREGE